MNSEISKLLINNENLQKQNVQLKQQADKPPSGMNDNIWLNGQLKDAKSQIHDLRRVN